MTAAILPAMECRDEYLARIDRVLAHIDGNLGADLSLASLARVADFSAFHFHRVFKAAVGETVHAYVKRMRLKSAAVALRHAPRPDVGRLARDLGFESPSDFARSFRSAYGMSPSRFARGTTGLLDPQPPKAEGSAVLPRAVAVRRLSDTAIAYIRCVGLNRRFENRFIEKAFGRLFAWAKARDLVSADTKVIGVTLDSPEAVPLAQCRFNACISVPEGTRASTGILVGRLGCGGKYACMSFERRDPRYTEAFFGGIEYLYKSWLPDSGYMPDDRPFLEFYREEEPGNGKLMVDFCVPLRPL